MRIKHFYSAVQRLLVLLTAALLLGSTATLFAAAAKDKQFSLSSERDIEISVLYEGTEPTVQVEAPGNKSYTKDADYAKVERAEGVVNFYIKKAPAGSWRVTASADVTVKVLAWNEPLTVDSFTNEAPKDGRVKVSALVKSAENLRYDWHVYAVPDFATTGLQGKQILLHQGTATANETAETQVDVGKLPDGSWTLSMDALYTYPDDTEVETSATAAKPITISGHNKAGEQSAFSTVTDLTAGTVTVNWEGVKDYYSSMLVSVAGGDGAPVFYSELENSQKSVRIVQDDEQQGSYTLRLMPLNSSGAFDTVYTRTLTFTPDISLSIDTAEATADMMATIHYSVGDKELPMDVTVGEAVKRYRVKGDNTVSVALETMTSNEVTARVYVNDNESYQVTKTIGVQSEPPMLELYGMSDNMVSKSDTFTVSGKTDPGVTLTLNGEKVEVAGDGSFTAEAKLNKGDNSLAFTAENSYGVKTTRTINVNRTDGDVAEATAKRVGVGSVLPVLIGGVFALVSAGAVALAAFLTKKRGKKIPVMIIYSLIAFLGMLTIGFAGATAYCYYMRGVENSAISGENLVGLLESEKYTVINEGLDRIKIWESRAFIMLILAIITLVVFALALTTVLLLRRAAKKKGMPPTPPTPPQPPAYPRNPQSPHNPQNPQPPVHPWHMPPGGGTPRQ